MRCTERYWWHCCAAAFAVVLALVVCAPSPGQSDDATLAQTPERGDIAVLVTAQGAHSFTVEIADDPVERATGLMFREQMDRDRGMLFDFASEALRAFWMKNTPLPLDIIYIAADGRVVSIARNTTPFSTDTIPSKSPARFVLEVNAGVADEIGLLPGDRLLHRRVER
ncbi:MAG: DUF192 domain-containing protein [Pseudomonadota bacterium]